MLDDTGAGFRSRLTEVANDFFLYVVGGSSGPELKYAGANVVAGQFGAVAPIGAEQTATGYEVAWKAMGPLTDILIS